MRATNQQKFQNPNLVQQKLISGFQKQLIKIAKSARPRLILEVREHLDQPLDALRELNRVSRKYVLLSVPYEPWFRLGNLARGRHLSRFGNHPEHVNLWSRSGFSRFVA